MAPTPSPKSRQLAGIIFHGSALQDEMARKRRRGEENTNSFANAKALFNQEINFFCQDSPSAINEIFMMFTQVYGAFFRVEVLEGELIRLRPLLFAARTALIVFTGGLK